MNKFIQVLCIFALFLVAGCGSKLNNENFSKVEVGQTEDQVKQVLGKPTAVESSGALGVTATTYTYKNGDDSVQITFVNGKVLSKSGSFK